MSKGILYIMTTSVEGLIKIGKTQDFNKRMTILEQNGYWNVSGLKRFFAIEVEDYDKKEKLIYKVFNNSQVSNSELFAIDKNVAKAILESFKGKQIYPELEKDKINHMHEVSKILDNNFLFKDCNILIGTELSFRKDESIKVITIDDKYSVKYNDQIMNISKAAWYCYNQNNAQMHLGFEEFKYNDKLLMDIYKENLGIV